MTLAMRLAFCCYLSASMIILAFALVYLFKGSFMPYHAEAVAMPWHEVPSHFQVLITALMRAFGGACLTIAVTSLVILYIPFKHGALWAKWLLPSLYLLSSLAGLYAMKHVINHTQAAPPVAASVLLIVLALAGLIASLYSKQHQ